MPYLESSPCVRHCPHCLGWKPFSPFSLTLWDEAEKVGDDELQYGLFHEELDFLSAYWEEKDVKFWGEDYLTRFKVMQR